MDPVPHAASFPRQPSAEVPPAAGAVQRRRQLESAQLYLCTDSRRDRGDLAGFVDAAFAGGVDIIQLRDKTVEAAEELACFEVLRAAAERHGRLFAANDRADVALLAGAPVLHVGQKDLSVAAARRLLGPDPVIGLSTHSPAQVGAATSTDGVDYFCTGPVWATPTKPGRAAVGLELVRHAAAYTATTASPLPWFAIGGIDSTTIGRVVDAGARRVVVVRAITEASDPFAAAARLRSALPPLADRRG